MSARERATSEGGQVAQSTAPGVLRGTMAPVNSGPAPGPVLIVDLGSLDLDRSADRRVLTVRADGRLLGMVTVPELASDPEAAFLALDDIAESCVLEVDGLAPGSFALARIAWLNPFTSCISTGSAQEGLVFTDHEPLVMDAPTMVGYVSPGPDAALRLAVNGRDIAQAQAPTFRAVSRLLAAHMN